MFCPNCGNQASEEIKFCRQCGANLRGVQEAMTARPGSGKFDLGKTWLAEALMSQEELDRRKGITPEIKRLREIKAGVITSLAGVGAMIFLYFFLGAVAQHEGRDADIVGRVWLAGLVPFLIGLGLIFNGMVIGRRLARLQEEQLQKKLPVDVPGQISAPGRTTDQLQAPQLRPADSFSITDQTTAHLAERIHAQPRRET
ncbi:MAG: zinc-ribbon domain-containing protein [Blastocatellia bacterium]